MSGLSEEEGTLFSRYYALARAPGTERKGRCRSMSLASTGLTKGSPLSRRPQPRRLTHAGKISRAPWGSAQEALYDDGFILTRRLRESELLAEYREDPSSFESYRNYLLSDSDFTGNLTESNAPRAASASPLSGARDERDEEGNLTGIYFSSAEASGGMLGSMILESSNELSTADGGGATCRRGRGHDSRGRDIDHRRLSCAPGGHLRSRHIVRVRSGRWLLL